MPGDKPVLPLQQIQAGQLRLIGISSEERVAGIEAPTFKESGVDVSIQNWRMVAAAPGISAEQKATITADIEKMVNSPAWQKALTDKGLPFQASEDRTVFIDHMHQFFVDAAHDGAMMFESYYNSHENLDGETTHQLFPPRPYFKQASLAYKRDFAR